MNILFLCVANSARSQMAEALAKEILGTSHKIYSAGSNPTKVNPFAINAMHEVGIDICKQKSEHIDNYINKKIDLVITLCAEEFCPIFNKKTKHLNWPLTDPDCKNKIISNKAMNLRFSKTRDKIKILIYNLKNTI